MTGLLLTGRLLVSILRYEDLLPGPFENDERQSLAVSGRSDDAGHSDSLPWLLVASPFFPRIGLLQVLAGPVVSGWVVRMDVPGYVRRVDGGQRGRIRGLGNGCNAAGLAGSGLVEQPDGQAGVAGGVAGFGLGEDGGGLAGGVGGEGEPGLTGQGGEDGGKLPGGVACGVPEVRLTCELRRWPGSSRRAS